MKEFNSESMSRDLKPQSTAIEFVLGIFLLIGSMALAREAVLLYSSGKQFGGLEELGFSIIVLGGCLDPINFVWICVPYTRRQVVASPQFAKIGWIVSGVGFTFFVVGLVGKHWLP